MQKELIEYVAKALVEDSSAVEVREVEGERNTILELKVSHDDIGRIIGKQGRIAKAMRTLLNAASARSGKRYSLEILD